MKTEHTVIVLSFLRVLLIENLRLFLANLFGVCHNNEIDKDIVSIASFGLQLHSPYSCCFFFFPLHHKVWTCPS